MKPFFALFSLGLALTTAGCVGAPARQPLVQPAQRPSAAEVTPGLNEKEPDTCKSAGMQGLVGQPSGNLRTVPAPGPVRIIAPDTVYDQEEYRSDRINVFVDGADVIRYLSCG